MRRTFAKIFKEILDLARHNQDKLTAPLPENVTSMTVLKTQDMRIDVHKNPSNPNEYTAKFQANAEAAASSVQKWVRKVKQPGHSGTHKNISVVKYNRDSLDFDEFANAAENNRN